MGMSSRFADAFRTGARVPRRRVASGSEIFYQLPLLHAGVSVRNSVQLGGYSSRDGERRHRRVHRPRASRRQRSVLVDRSVRYAVVLHHDARRGRRQREGVAQTVAGQDARRERSAKAIAATCFVHHARHGKRFARVPSPVLASYATAPSAPRRRQMTLFAPASRMSSDQLFGRHRLAVGEETLLSRSFGDHTSPSDINSRSADADNGVGACVNGSIEINPQPAFRSAPTSATSGRAGLIPKCTARVRRHFSGQDANSGLNIAYNPSLASSRHTCVRRPSLSVICHARGVDAPETANNPSTSTPRSTSQRRDDSGQSSSPTPATIPTRADAPSR